MVASMRAILRSPSVGATAHAGSSIDNGGMSSLSDAVAGFEQAWPRPSAPRPIVIIGAGSIVRDAHLPVYERLGFPVAGIFDLDADAAAARAREFGIERTYASLAQAAAEPGTVFDVAVPPQAIAPTVEQLPEGAYVIIQKPLGRDLGEARAIRNICAARRITAAVNFQLRFAPNMRLLRLAISEGLLGDVVDVEVRINLHTPWEYWAFLKGAPRLEILMHSIHYIDLIRHLVGEPRGVYAKVVRHPELAGHADARSSIILDYGETVRCSLTMDHTHDFGARFGMSQLKVEGTKGAAIAKMGVNLNYPHGEPDEILLAERGSDAWDAVPLRGSWFLEAFEGPMSNLQRVAAGEDRALVSPVADAVRTMAVVEACYASSAAGGTAIDEG
jgi:predicted dehydrogenase